MGITHLKVKAAVVQAAPVWLDLQAELLPRIPYAEMKIIPATGHLPPLELAEIVSHLSERLGQEK